MLLIGSNIDSFQGRFYILQAVLLIFKFIIYVRVRAMLSG